MHAGALRIWCRAVRAACAFPPGARTAAARGAGEVAREVVRRAVQSGSDRGDHRPGDRVPASTGGFRLGVGEPIGTRRCFVCCTDDVALDGWVAIAHGVVCPDCSRAALGGAMPYGRLRARYRGRVGSPRRALGEVYQSVVAFKERQADWVTLAGPLSCALAQSVRELQVGAEGSRVDIGPQPLLLPVPAYREHRPHVRILVALAAVQLPDFAVRLDVLAKTRDFAQKGLSRAERLVESAEAYVVRAGSRSVVRDRHVIVADDLVTTGTTLEACARALLAAGAASVDGACVVRVIRGPPERVLTIGSRQVRIQLRELDGRGRATITPENGVLWVQFACSGRCPVTAVAGPYPLPSPDVMARHRWMCACGTSHAIRMRREWGGAMRDYLATAVGDRRPREVLVGVLQGPPAYVS